MTTMSERMDGQQPPPFQPPSVGRSDQVEGIRLTEQQLRARRARSIAIALALGAFVIVIFVVTLVKLGSNVLTRPM